MAKLSPTQVEIGKSWLYDLFVANGAQRNPNDNRHNFESYCGFYNLNSNNALAAKKIYEAIKFRRVDYKNFVEIDNALDDLSIVNFFNSLAKTPKFAASQYGQKDMTAKYIANFCAENGIVWDDSNITSYEADEIKKTDIGKALYDFKCMASQATKKNSKTKTSTSSAGKSSGQAPQNGYKSLGPLSGNVSNLVGTPNNKIALNAQHVFCVEADKLGQNTPCLFATPVSSNGDKVDVKKAAKVKIGSANGYSDCKLWWDDLADAQNFLNDYLKNYSGKFQNLHIAKASPDSNGYFKIRTELGNAFIKASKLNEELYEYLEQDELNIVENKINSDKSKYTQAYIIDNIDVYDEAFDKYRD